MLKCAVSPVKAIERLNMGAGSRNRFADQRRIDAETFGGTGMSRIGRGGRGGYRGYRGGRVRLAELKGRMLTCSLAGVN